MSKPLESLSLPPFDMGFMDIQENIWRRIQASTGLPAHYFQPPNIRTITVAGLPDGMALLVYKGKIEGVIFNMGSEQ